VEHCPDADTTMEDAPLGSGVVESEDATKCVLRNASLGSCNDALPAMHSSDDGGQEHQGDALMSDHVTLNGVGSARALYESDSNPAYCSGQSNVEPHAEKEGHMAVDLLAHEVDPYEDAMRDNPDGSCDAFFPSRPHSCGPNILHNKVGILFTCLFNFRSVFFLLVNTFYLQRLFVLVVFLIWIISMTSIIFVNNIW
jgi:hypothetical protein